MGLIRRNEAVDLPVVHFGGTAPAEAEGRPARGEVRLMNFENLSPRAEEAAPPVAAVEPAVAPSVAAGSEAEQAPPNEPPPAPIFEVPEELLRALYEDAVLRGLDDGRAQAMAEREVERERFTGALLQLEQVSKQLVDRNRVTLITLACKIAERLVRHDLSVHPEHLMRLVREAIDALSEKDEVVVHCATADHDFLAARREDLMGSADQAFRVVVRADETLTAGDFRVETRSGASDARIATRIAQVQDVLVGQGGGSP